MHLISNKVGVTPTLYIYLFTKGRVRKFLTLRLRIVRNFLTQPKSNQ